MKIGRPPEKSDENRRKSAKIVFPEIVQDHSGSVPGLEKPRKTLKKHDFGPKKIRKNSGDGIRPR